MKNVISYDDFLFEDTSSSVTSFLKSQYNNIFKDPNTSLNNLFVDFTKKLDTDKNLSNLYQRYIRANQTTIQNEINKAETIDEINKLLSDEIKYFYFSLKPVVNKLQNDEFTITEIFKKSRDKRLQALMSYPEDKFSNAVSQYVGEIIVPEIKKDSGINTQENNIEVTTEKIKLNRVFEATEAENLLNYKKSAIKWINLSLFDLLKNKIQILNQVNPNTYNMVDQLSDKIKSTTNDNAKKMILNHIINMNKDELENLANFLGLSEDEIGKL